MRASLFCNAKAVELLILEGADKNAKASNGWTPLFWAVIGGDIETVKMLVAHDVDLHVRDQDGESAKDEAYNHNHHEIDNFLRDAGCADEYSLPEELRIEPSPTVVYDFFLSYRQRKFRDNAVWLKAQLELAGCKVFLDIEANELACINTTTTAIDREQLKAIIYKGVRSSQCTLFFEAWDEMGIDPKTGKSSRAFNWQHFESIYSNHVVLLQGVDIFSSETIRGFVQLVANAPRHENPTNPP